jgi:dihydrofolate synthase/folylpolyglutamate synthase
VIFDGGHNPQGVAAAVRSVKAYFPEQPVYLLSAVMADKDYDEMIEKLKPVTKQVFTVSTGMPRALTAKAYAEQFCAHKVPAEAYEDAKEGIRVALATSREKGIPLICLGSLYLYSMVAEVIESL